MEVAALRSAVYEHVLNTWGGSLVESEATVSVGITPTQIVAADPERIALIIVNVDAVSLTVRPSNRPTLAVGIVLQPNGSSLSINATEDFTLVTREWSGISSKASHSVYVFSIRRFALEAPPSRFVPERG